MEEQQQQKKPIDYSSNVSLPSAEIETNSELDTELSNSPEKQKKIEEITSTTSHNTLKSQVPNNSTSVDYHDTSFNGKNVGYCSFSTTDKKSSDSIQSNPIREILNQAATSTSDHDSEEDEQTKKIAAAKKLLFPSAVATSFSEVVDTLRDERRQEFSPIYKDETPEQIILRQSKQKHVGSLLAKRIRWDDLKRKRDEDHRQTQIPIRYGPYGPIYANQQQSYASSYGQYNQKIQNQPEQSFANPYEQYYAAVQNQYEQMTQMVRTQQEYNGFWPGYNQQSSLQNNNNSIQQQSQPYTYPYPAMYSNNMAGINPNIPSSYTSTDYNSFLSSMMQPPPPPPNEPYPY